MDDLTNLRHLEAADGWLGLGDWQEADKELDCLAPEMRDQPEVLHVRLRSFTASARWSQANAVAAQLLKLKVTDPSMWITFANLMREQGFFRAGRLTLSTAVDLFPKDPFIHFNSACMECLCGRLEQALERVREAIQLGPRKKVITAALQDADLRPIRAEILAMQ